MGAFMQNDITSNGLSALSRALTGETLQFTKIVLGSGFMPEGKTPRSMEAVVTPAATLAITHMNVGTEPGTAILGTVFNNVNVASDFYYRELALYAQTETTGEVLYCYGNAGNDAELIPAGGGANVVEKKIDIETVVAGAATVTAYISLEAYASVRQVQDAISTANTAMTKAQAAQSDSAEAKTTSAQASADVASFGATVDAIDARTNTLWSAIFTEVTGNPFSISFENLDDVTLVEGTWNSALKRIEC